MAWGFSVVGAAFVNVIICMFATFFFLKLRAGFNNKWAQAVLEIVLAGFLISAVGTFAIVFLTPDQISEHVHYNISKEHIFMVLSTESLWHLFSLMGFLLLYRVGRRLGILVGRYIDQPDATGFLAMYFAVATLISFFLPGGFYTSGFYETYIRGGEWANKTSDWQRVLINIPSTVGFGALLLLRFRYCSFGSQVRRNIGRILTLLAMALVGWMSFIIGARGFIIRALAVYWVYSRVSDKKVQQLLLPAGVVVASALIFLSLVAELRVHPIVVGGRLDVKMFTTVVKEQLRKVPLQNQIAMNVRYTILRFFPIEAGVFMQWVKSTGSYAGGTPLIGALFSIIPRSLWPDKPAPGSVSPSVLDSPAWITGRIMGTPKVCRGTTPAASAFWIGGYPLVVISSFIVGGFMAFFIGLGQGAFFPALLMFSILALSVGGPFLRISLPGLLLFVTRFLVPIGVMLVVWRIMKREFLPRREGFSSKNNRLKCAPREEPPGVLRLKAGKGPTERGAR